MISDHVSHHMDEFGLGLGICIHNYAILSLKLKFC